MFQSSKARWTCCQDKEKSFLPLFLRVPVVAPEFPLLNEVGDLLDFGFDVLDDWERSGEGIFFRLARKRLHDQLDCRDGIAVGVVQRKRNEDKVIVLTVIDLASIDHILLDRLGWNANLAF